MDATQTTRYRELLQECDALRARVEELEDALWSCYRGEMDHRQRVRAALGMTDAALGGEA